MDTAATELLEVVLSMPPGITQELKGAQVIYDKPRLHEFHGELRRIIKESRISLFAYREDDASIPDEVHGLFADGALYGLATDGGDGKRIFIHRELIVREWGEKSDLVEARVLAHELGHELMHDLGTKFFLNEEELATIQEEDRLQEIEAELFTMRVVDKHVGPNYFNTRYALGYIKNQIQEGGSEDWQRVTARLQEASERVDKLLSSFSRPCRALPPPERSSDRHSPESRARPQPQDQVSR